MPLAPVVLLYPVSLIFAYIMFAGPVALSVNSIAIRKDKTDFPLI